MYPCPEKYEGYISSLTHELNKKINEVLSKLSLSKRIRLRLRGYTPLCRIHLRLPDGREADGAVYVVKCSSCGNLFIDYIHGYSRYFVCPYCGKRTYI